MELIEIIDEIEKLLHTIKKNPKRKFKSATILKKQTKLKELLDKFHKIKEELEKTKSLEKNQKGINKFSIIYKELQKQLDQIAENSLTNGDSSSEYSDATSEVESIPKTDSEPLAIVTNQQSKMSAEDKFNLATAIKIIPEFKGEAKELQNFLKIIKLYNDTLATAEKAKLLDFVFCVKLKDTVRNKLATKDTPSTYANLEKILKEACQPKNTTENILAKMTSMKQRNLTVEQFSEKITDLACELNRLTITEFGEENKTIIEKMHDKTALNSFRNGLNENLKIPIMAARLKTFGEAVNLASQIEVPQQHEHKILHYNKPMYHPPMNSRYNNKYRYSSRNSNTQSWRQNNGNQTNNYRNNGNNASENRRNNGNQYNNRNQNQRNNNTNYRRNDRNSNRFRNNHQARINFVHTQGNGMSPGEGHPGTETDTE